ncbi:MAG TPA: chemotaxis protein CheX [Verrucomicrobiae bacterium]|nr:chemotaxis protein CheX [Verrucomicrobiae bacterium]
MPTQVKLPHDQMLAQRYGLESLPESISQLTRLVAQQDADLEEIGKLISTDKAITGRLLRFANPGIESEREYDITTVEEALMRTGLAPVILLAMLEPLSRAVLNAFEMFLTPVASAPVKTLSPLLEEHVMAAVQFSGKGSGVVQLRLAAAAARSLACAALGLSPDAPTGRQEIDDVIGELANIIGGKLESNLCDTGITCKLTAPQVSRVNSFQKQSRGGVSERLGFSGHGINAFIDVTVNPWSE